MTKPLSGSFRLHEEGYGFVSYGEYTYFVAKKDRHVALDGDSVTFVPTKIPKKGMPEARITSVISRAKTHVVGTYNVSGGFVFVTLDGPNQAQDVVLRNGEEWSLRPGHKVLLHIPEESLEAVIVEVIGHISDAGVDVTSILLQHEIPLEFPEEVIRAASHIPAVIAEEEWKRREDLTAQQIVTIDGADAKDLDDAISLKRGENGEYILGVHIADVSYYVRENDSIDKEAYKRGTSVYVVDRVIPMLPERLSNALCSLQPHVPRLAFSCEMVVDATGNVKEYRIFESVIQSAARFTYGEVNNMMIRHDEQLRDKYHCFIPMLSDMEELAIILQDRRKREGALDLDIPETRVEINMEGTPLSVGFRVREMAERMIESFMLLANETVALHVTQHDIPILYRIHEMPSPEKMAALASFLQRFGIRWNGNPARVSPYTFQQVLEQLSEKEEGPVLRKWCLRSLKKAVYSGENEGHFGLGMTHYAHFTSPIRRYPDLLLHRALKEATHERFLSEEEVEEAGLHTSYTEKRAMEAERQVETYKKAQWMRSYIGHVYEGRITSVTKFGIFIELPQGVEGCIPTSSLSDYFIYFEDSHSLLGKRSRVRYRVGQRVEVQVREVQPEEGEITFSFTRHPDNYLKEGQVNKQKRKR